MIKKDKHQSNDNSLMINVIGNDHAATLISRVELSDMCSTLLHYIAQFLCLYVCVLSNPFEIVCNVLG